MIFILVFSWMINDKRQNDTLFHPQAVILDYVKKLFVIFIKNEVLSRLEIIFI